MNMMRMIALIACLQQQSGRSRIGPRLMATAFTPQLQRKQEQAVVVSTRSTSYSAPSLLSGSASFASTPFVSSGTLLSSTTKLYSTTPTTSAASSNNFDESLLEIDPYSHEAKSDLISFYKENGIDDGVDMDQVHNKLLRLTEEVLSWNQRLNLVSRKDCTAAVIYHRHVLPSVALLPLILDDNDSIMINSNTAEEGEEKQTLNIIDVGTGGGFPGLPLALLLPHVQFTLVDSVQKKLVAVGEMAAELEMTNVRIHCGRVEEMYEGEKGRKEHFRRYDVVLGRSVTALPRFCGWVSDLLKKKKRSEESTTAEQGEGEEGRLIYIIGGDLDDLVESRIVHDIPLDQLLQRPAGSSDKRGLIFTASDVEAIGLESGEKQKIVRSGPPGSSKKNKNKNNNQRGGGGKKMAKGAWSKKRNDIKKERGYDNFQRYES